MVSTTKSTAPSNESLTSEVAALKSELELLKSTHRLDKTKSNDTIAQLLEEMAIMQNGAKEEEKAATEYGSEEKKEEILIQTRIRLTNTTPGSLIPPVLHPARDTPIADYSSMSVTATDIEPVLKKMLQKQLLGQSQSKLAIVYDMDAIDAAITNLMTTFPKNFQHRFAMKSCPLSFFVRRVLEHGMGVECASRIEAQHALKLGCDPSKIVFDSPCKTADDIAFAIEAGVDINADNFDELETIIDAISSSRRTEEDIPNIGIRINPLVGAGSNEYLSVSMKSSKFGTPLIESNRIRIIEYFKKYSWLNTLHCHVGSQGCDLDLLSSGSRRLVDLANEIDEKVGASQVKFLNIGGGLSVNYEDEIVKPTYGDYVTVLKQKVPELFSPDRTILTEFGRSISAKTAWTVSEVEYVKAVDSTFRTAIIHAGSDLFLRTCYVPKLFPHLMEVYRQDGTKSKEPFMNHNVAGPLCFGGDLIGREVELPTAHRGDFVVIRDSGSNTISLFSRHCSRPAPAVYAYQKVRNASGRGEISFNVALMKPEESAAQVMQFWG